MLEKRMSRRQLLRGLGMGVAGVTLAACQPKVVEVERVVTQVVEGEAKVVEVQKEVTRVVAATAAPARQVEVRFMCRAGEAGIQQRFFADQWNETNPNIKIKKEDTAWADLATKVEVQAATGTLADVVFQVIWWFPHLVRKGIWAPIDDFIAARDPGMDDFYDWIVEICSYDGKMYALPGSSHPGKCQLVYNKTLFDAKGVALPTLEWDWDDWTQAGLALTDKDKGIWGIVGLQGTTETDAHNFRAFDGNIFDLEGKKVMLQEENTLECMKLERARIVDMQIAPKAEQLTANDATKTFLAGAAATLQANLGTIGFPEAIGSKFEWDVTLMPKGPRGTRGTMAFCNQFVINSKSKVAQESYDFMVYLTSPTAAKWLPLMMDKQPQGRISAWTDPEVEKKAPIYKLVHDVIYSKGVLPFPMPANTLYTEFDDVFTNEMSGIYQGDKTIEEYLPVVAQKCQAVLDQPLP